MTHNESRKEFVARLRQVAAKVRHSELAAYMGMKRATLRNCLYRGLIGPFAMEVFRPKLYRKWQAVKKSKKKR